MQAKNWWNHGKDQEERDLIRNQVISAMTAVEKEKKWPISSLFDDVYAELPRHLQEQKAELKEFIEAHPEAYPSLDQHLPWKD